MMKIRFPLYEGDGYLHYRGHQVVESTAPVEQRTTAQIKVPLIDKRARELRGAAISKAFCRLSGWIERKIGNAKRRRIDAYLSQSTDRADLERRLKEIERNSQLRFG